MLVFNPHLGDAIELFESKAVSLAQASPSNDCFCADTREEAELLASTAIYRKMTVQRGDREALLSPEQVQDRRKSFTAAQEAQYDHIASGYTAGTPEHCCAEIDSLAKAFDAQEIAIVTVTHDFTARLKSYELLAKG